MGDDTFDLSNVDLSHGFAVDGSYGTNTLSFENAHAGVVVDLDGAHPGSGVSAHNVQQLIGSEHSDTLFALPDMTVKAGAGDDLISAYSGDVIDGGAGNDSIIINAGTEDSNLVNVSFSGGYDYLSVSHSAAPPVELDVGTGPSGVLDVGKWTTQAGDVQTIQTGITIFDASAFSSYDLDMSISSYIGSTRTEGQFDYIPFGIPIDLNDHPTAPSATCYYSDDVGIADLILRVGGSQIDLGQVRYDHYHTDDGPFGPQDFTTYSCDFTDQKGVHYHNNLDSISVVTSDWSGLFGTQGTF